MRGLVSYLCNMPVILRDVCMSSQVCICVYVCRKCLSMPRYTCSRCGLVFPSRQALGGHRSGVLTCVPAPAVADAAPAVAVPAAAAGTAGNGVPAMAQPQQPPQQQVAGAGAIQFSIAQLLQRPTRLFQEHNVVPCSVPSASTCNTANTYQLHETQSAYEEYCELVRSAYSDEFWRVFATVYRERAVIIDRVLKTCKKVFVPGKSRKNLFAVRI